MTVDKQKILAGEASESMAYFADYSPNLAAAFGAATASAGTLPSSPTATWGSLRDGGWISEDGLVAARDYATTDLPAYGTKQPVRTFVTTDTRTFAVNFLETNPVSVSVYNGLRLNPLFAGDTGATSGYIADGATAIKVVAGASTENRSYACVFDVLDPGRGRVRYLVPSAQVSTVGEITYRGGQAAIRPVTFSAQPVSVGTPTGATGNYVVGDCDPTVSVIELVYLGADAIESCA